jgi:uncharacterized protein YcfJ
MEPSCGKYISPASKWKLETAMNSLVAFGIGAVAAVAVGVAVAMGVNAANAPPTLAEDADGRPVQVASLDPSAGIEKAEARADAAEARARAAERKAACERERQEASNKGAVVGGVTGAVIGSQVAGNGARSEGSVIGGLAGVMIGRDIAKEDHRC